MPIMTKPVNAIDKPSSTKKAVDNGGKAKVKRADREYKENEPHSGEIARKHENEEQPVHSVKDEPKV